jgi:hypothetical protein
MADNAQARIRTWTQDGFTLHVYDTNRCDRLGKSILAYEFFDEEAGKEPVFHGKDFHCSLLHGKESDKMLAAILGLLSVQPGDTDKEHFDEYSERQLEWCQRRGEELAWLAWELEQPYRRLEQYKIRHETREDAWKAGRRNRALELHYRTEGLEQRLTLAAGCRDEISAHLNEETVYVLATNRGLGYVGLETWHDGDKIDDLFFQNAEDNLGDDVWELDDRELLRRLEAYLE